MTTAADSYHPARCACVDAGAGQCQLRDQHDGMHAARTPEQFLTWHGDGSDPSRWRLDAAPAWLIFLSWASGFEPWRTIRWQPSERPVYVDERNLRYKIDHGRDALHNAPAEGNLLTAKAERDVVDDGRVPIASNLGSQAR